MINKPTIAIGPELPEFGSWNWIGEWLIDSLKPFFEVQVFSDVGAPQLADVIVYLKFKPNKEQLRSQSASSRQIYMPVDIYGSAGEIDNDIATLRCFDLVIVHSRRLVRYFAPMTSCVYLDHPLKFITPEIRTELVQGPLLWVGKSCNLPDAVPSLNSLSHQSVIRVLMDIPSETIAPDFFGLSAKRVQIGQWSPERHIEWMSSAMAAVDVKGVDFRARHKPPAKALDFIASGIPVITNRGSSVDLNLTPRGIPLLYQEDWKTQLTSGNQQELSQRAVLLRQALAPDAVSLALREFLDYIPATRRE